MSLKLDLRTSVRLCAPALEEHVDREKFQECLEIRRREEGKQSRKAGKETAPPSKEREQRGGAGGGPRVLALSLQASLCTGHLNFFFFLFEIITTLKDSFYYPDFRRDEIDPSAGK